MGGPWEDMNARRRHALLSLRALGIPGTPDVFAIYDAGGDRLYVERAPSLRLRLWGSNPKGGPGEPDAVLTGKLADRLGVDRREVVAHLEGCCVAWIETGSGASARQLEGELMGQFDPSESR